MSVLQISMQIFALVTIDISIKRKERNYVKKDKKETSTIIDITCTNILPNINVY